MAEILVVDDSSDTVDSMARWLRPFGHNVQTADDGRQAVELALRQRPDYVVLDIGLPKLNGYQVAAALRRELPGPLVIIAVTGYADEDCRRRALAAGCDHYFAKPIDPTTLAALLSRPVLSPGSPVHGGPALGLGGGTVDCAITSLEADPSSPLGPELRNDAPPPEASRA
jgi:CheY-like chemotaxis protein